MSTCEPSAMNTSVRPLQAGRQTKPTGFTLVEVLVIFAIVVLVLSVTIPAFEQFHRGFSSGEQANEAAREATMLVESLRNDLHNAVPPSDLASSSFRQVILCNAAELAFPVFSDAAGTIVPVRYQISGSRVQRRLGDAAPQTLVTGSLASLSWTLHQDGDHQVSPFQAGRIWIHIEGMFGRQAVIGGVIGTVPVSTNLFPVRWNRFVQGHPQG